MKFAYLVKVESGANNNKYYQMTECDNATLTCTYGRIGNSSSQTATYSMSQWSKKYNEKLKKGYEDKTNLVAEPTITAKNRDYIDIPNTSIAKIVARLQAMAKQAIEDNYTVSSNKVTQAMLEEAQVVLDRLINSNDKGLFNEILTDLFKTIPRKMSKVVDYLARDNSDFSEIIQREQDLLDVMRGQVIQQSVASQDETPNMPLNNHTILEAMGLKFEEITDKEKSMIKGMFGRDSDKFVNGWKVTNLKTQDKFNNFIKEKNITDCRLLFHGSSSANWWSIINIGLMLRPNAPITGKMWGYGIYTSPDFDKSRGYTSVSGSRWMGGSEKTGFMALMNVAYGKPHHAYSFDNKYYSMNYENLQKIAPNCNSIHAHGGTGMLRKDEIIVYQEEAITIQYILEIK